MGCVYYFCRRVLQAFSTFGTTKRHDPFDPPEQSIRLSLGLFGAPGDPRGLRLHEVSPKTRGPYGHRRTLALAPTCCTQRVGEGRATISPTSRLSQKPQLSKGEVVHAFDPCYCYHLFTDQHFKPYLWLAGHVSGLSESGYNPCGFLMIYLDKICGMRERKLSAPLCGTSVHVRK